MRRRHVMVLMILLLLADYTSQFNEKMGPFDLVFKYPEDCCNEDALMKLDLRVRKRSRSGMTFEGTVTIKNHTFNDDVKVKAIMHQFTPSGWKDNYYVFDFGGIGACTFLREYIGPAFLNKYIGIVIDQNNNYIYLNETGYCDIPPGTYNSVNRPDFNLEGIFNAGNFRSQLPKQFFYGKYRTKILFFYKDFEHEIGCIFGYYDIVPKKQPKKRTNGAPSQPTE